MKKIMFALAMSCAALVASPALAGEQVTISVVGQYGIGAVYDDTDVAMAPLPGGVSNLNYAGNPAFFEGKLLCASGRDSNWAIRKDGTIDDSPRNTARRPVCTPIVNGTATLTTPFGDQQDLFIADANATRILAWAADDTLTPYHNF